MAKTTIKANLLCHPERSEGADDQCFLLPYSNPTIFINGKISILWNKNNKILFYK